MKIFIYSVRIDLHFWSCRRLWRTLTLANETSPIDKIFVNTYDIDQSMESRRSSVCATTMTKPVNNANFEKRTWISFNDESWKKIQLIVDWIQKKRPKCTHTLKPVTVFQEFEPKVPSTESGFTQKNSIDYNGRSKTKIWTKFLLIISVFTWYVSMY